MTHPPTRATLRMSSARCSVYPHTLRLNFRPLLTSSENAEKYVFVDLLAGAAARSRVLAAACTLSSGDGSRGTAWPSNRGQEELAPPPPLIRFCAYTVAYAETPSDSSVVL